VEFGSHPLLMVPAALLIVLSAILRALVSRHLTKWILLGLPELAPEQFHTPLLTDGVYARVRNPRYLQVLVGVAGVALLSNYLAGYVLFFVTLILLRVIIWMEEKELRNRFGKSFDEYCALVPRLVPRWRLRPVQ
jgi:protein-S-isoprenylcysteine O-methyltransferase Ste14